MREHAAGGEKSGEGALGAMVVGNEFPRDWREKCQACEEPLTMGHHGREVS